MGGEGFAPGSAGLQLAAGVPLLRPEEQVFVAMLDGWRNQQLARNLAFSTINGREKTVAAFARHSDAFPWRWTPAMIDEWLGDLRAVRHLRRSTLRAYQQAVRSFCYYVTDPRTPHSHPHNPKIIPMRLLHGPLNDFRRPRRPCPAITIAHRSTDNNRP